MTSKSFFVLRCCWRYLSRNGTFICAMPLSVCSRNFTPKRLSQPLSFGSGVMHDDMLCNGLDDISLMQNIGTHSRTRAARRLTPIHVSSQSDWKAQLVPARGRSPPPLCSFRACFFAANSGLLEMKSPVRSCVVLLRSANSYSINAKVCNIAPSDKTEKPLTPQGPTNTSLPSCERKGGSRIERGN